MKNKFNNDIYSMYEKTIEKNEQLIKELKKEKLEIANLKYQLNYQNKSFQNKLEKEIKKGNQPLLEENQILKDKLEKTIKEIERLQQVIAEKDSLIVTLTERNANQEYQIDELSCSLKKDSSNSGITTSMERTCNTSNNKTGPNTYNNREETGNPTGGQKNHPGTTLTKEKLEKKIKEQNIIVKEIVHYINGSEKKEDKIKYKIGIHCEVYVEKHIFKHCPTSEEKLPKEFYSDVTYKDDVKMLILMLGMYYSVSYNKTNEFLFDLTNGIIDISEGTIDNIYEEFSDKSEETLNNITVNLLNGKFQHTDEITTKENGKASYYRGYANEKNALYKYHHQKGDAPIKEDGILPNYFGTIISDHEVGIFKYGKSNQDCVIHIGRYCIEKEQNIVETYWPIYLYHLLLKFEKNRKILSKFGRTEFTEEEIKEMEGEYDSLLEMAEIENQNISSKYWKDESNTLMRRLKKYKASVLFYIHDFDIPYDNNFMERALRMIKGKTKVSGGFRSENGGKRFGRIMSVIKTAKLRKLKPSICIAEILKGKALFA